MRLSNGGENNPWNINKLLNEGRKINNVQIIIDHNEFFENYKDQLQNLHVINVKNIRKIYYDIFKWSRASNDLGDDKIRITFQFGILMNTDDPNLKFETISLECLVPNKNADDANIHNYKPLSDFKRGPLSIFEGRFTSCKKSDLTDHPLVALLFDFDETDATRRRGNLRFTCDQSLYALSRYLAQYAYVKNGKDILNGINR